MAEKKKAKKSAGDSATRKKWEKEKKTVKAIQLAFDVGEEVQYQVRREALDMGVTPSDRIRQILGLPVNTKPVRPRLSISLSAEDFKHLSDTYEVEIDDRLSIKQKAAEALINHVKK